MNGRERASEKKSKKGGRGRGGDDDESAHVAADDVSMLASAPVVSTKDEDGNELSPEDLQDQLVEQLAEKRASTRQAALQRLIDQLQLNCDFDFVTERAETLQLYLLNSVRKGDSPEVVLACRALQLMAATLGGDSEKLLEAATPVLHTFLKNTSKGASGRAATAEALGFLSFIGGAGDKDSLQAMALLLEALHGAGKVPEAVSVAVWEAWGLLASSLVQSRLAGEVCVAHVPTLTRFLDDESTDVKTAAGENIALIVEARQAQDAEKAAQGEDEDDEEQDDDQQQLDATALASPTDSINEQLSGVAVSASSTAAAAAGSKAGSKRKKPSAASASAAADPLADLTALISKLSALATDGNRHRARKERAVQRKSFRDILRTVEHGEAPDESLKIEKSRHSFEGWPAVKQLAAFREVLGKGLNVHFGQTHAGRNSDPSRGKCTWCAMWCGVLCG